MPTVKSRLNITLTPTTVVALKQLAARDRVPRATKAADLIQIALEIEEDQIWDILARKRDTSRARFVSHARAWQ